MSKSLLAIIAAAVAIGGFWVFSNRAETPVVAEAVPVATDLADSEVVADVETEATEPEAETPDGSVADVGTEATDPETETPDEAVDFGLRITISGEASGVITIDLFEETAPLHVAQITAIAAGGGYDNVVFHRVIDGFMAQTGDVEHGKEGADMRRAGTGASELPDIPAEFSDLDFDRGVVGMARSQNPNSANSQFFIMFDAGHFLNGQYTVVGAVTEGMDVVDQIKRGEGPNGAVIGAPDKMATVTVTE